MNPATFYGGELHIEEKAPAQIQDPSGSLLNVYTYAEGNGVAGGLAPSAIQDVGSGLHFLQKYQTPPFPESLGE